MEKLPEEFKSKWVAALRSREYQQGRNSLIRYNSLTSKEYCCLGVACRVFTGSDPVDTGSGYIDGDFRDQLLNKGFPDLLTASGHSNPIVRSLVKMNDAGTPFSQIADYIERNL